MFLTPRSILRSMEQFIFLLRKKKVDKWLKYYVRMSLFRRISLERLMSCMTKKKPATFQRKHSSQVNVKALYWIGSIAAAIVIIMTILLVFDK